MPKACSQLKLQLQWQTTASFCQQKYSNVKIFLCELHGDYCDVSSVSAQENKLGYIVAKRTIALGNA